MQSLHCLCPSTLGLKSPLQQSNKRGSNKLCKFPLEHTNLITSLIVLWGRSICRSRYPSLSVDESRALFVGVTNLLSSLLVKVSWLWSQWFCLFCYGSVPPHSRNLLIQFDVSESCAILEFTRKSFPFAGFLLFWKECSLSSK